MLLFVGEREIGNERIEGRVREFRVGECRACGAVDGSESRYPDQSSASKK